MKTLQANQETSCDDFIEKLKLTNQLDEVFKGFANYIAYLFIQFLKPA